MFTTFIEIQLQIHFHSNRNYKTNLMLSLEKLQSSFHVFEQEYFLSLKFTPLFYVFTYYL